jgi:glucosamine--fructose-6-phosphate aminotransferase (isomerizing)
MPSLMIQEIREQPAALERTLREERRTVARIRKLAGRNNFRLILLIARGTSDNAALFGRYLIEITTPYLASLAAPSIHTLCRARQNLRQTLAIGISQSGEGTDVNLVLESCRRQGAFTIGITNNADSTMAGLVDEVLLSHAGAEHSVAATKTYTAQMLLLYELAWALGARFTRREVERLPELAAQALRLEAEVRKTARRYRSMERCVVVGRGLNYANSYEFALKLMETSHVVAERFSSADFLHGPIALIERGFPVFVFLPQGVVRPGLEKVVRRLNELKARVLLIGNRGPHPPVRASFLLPGRLPELWTPIPYIIPAQLFAAYLAEAKGLNPDRPRHLQKVTRTV